MNRTLLHKRVSPYWLAMSVLILCVGTVGCSTAATQPKNPGASATGTNRVASANQATNGSMSNSSSHTEKRISNESNKSSATSQSNQVSTMATKPSLSIPASNSLKYTMEGETDSGSAKAYVSQNQPFYIYVLNGFEAHSTTGGSDVVASTQDANAYMRIQLLDSHTTSKQLDTKAKNIVDAVKPDVKQMTGLLPGGEFFTNCEAFQANGSKASTLVYASHLRGQPILVTIHIPLEWESPAQFWSMLQTLRTVQSGQHVTTSGSELSSQDGVNNGSKTNGIDITKKENLAYSSNGHIVTKPVHAYVSQNVPIYMYLLDDYKAHRDGSATDVFVWQSDLDVWMKVTKMSSTASQAQLESTAKSTFSKWIHNIHVIPNSAMPNTSFFYKCSGFIASGSGQIERVYISHMGNQTFEAHMNVPVDDSSVAALKAMLGTIHTVPNGGTIVPT